MTTANQLQDVVIHLNESSFDLALIDLKLPDTDGLSLLEMVKNRQPSCKAIIMTSFSTIQTAVKAMQMGAYDYIEKPFDEIEKLEQLIDTALLNKETENGFGELEAKAMEVGCIIGNNAEMKRLYKIAEKIANKQIPVLIIGETGTGKEVLAKFIHKMSQRAHEPFFAINCGAIPENLLESELFGHEKGAFTGANQTRKGFFELARNGTLFLDEIGEASLQTQVKLLRVLETHEFMRIGGEQIIQTNAKIISATNVDLEEACLRKDFRPDLLYRLEGVKLTVPPLRDRKNDIPLLVRFFIHELPEIQNVEFSPRALECLQEYDWPGNLRELMNVVAQSIALHDNHLTPIEDHHLPDKIKTYSKVSSIRTTDHEKTKESRHPLKSQVTDEQAMDVLMELTFDGFMQTMMSAINFKQGFDLQKFQSELRTYETKMIQDIITETLRHTLGNQKKAGQLLGINTRTLRYLLNEKGNKSASEDQSIKTVGD